jgi:hypothetical protein
VGTDIERSVIPFSDSSVCPDTAVDSVDSFMEDDSAFWDQALHLENEVVALANHSLQPQKVLSGNVPCKHMCSNKNSCRHLCCKEGVPLEGKRKRRYDHVSTSTQQVPFSSTSTIVNKISRKKKLYLLDDIQKSPQKEKRVEDDVDSDELFDESVFTSTFDVDEIDIPPIKVLESPICKANGENALKTKNKMTVPDCSYDDSYATNLPSACIKIPHFTKKGAEDDYLELDLEAPDSVVYHLESVISRSGADDEESQTENHNARNEVRKENNARNEVRNMEPDFEVVESGIKEMDNRNECQDDLTKKETVKGPEVLENDDCCQLFNSLFR